MAPEAKLEAYHRCRAADRVQSLLPQGKTVLTLDSIAIGTLAEHRKHLVVPHEELGTKIEWRGPGGHGNANHEVGAENHRVASPAQLLEGQPSEGTIAAQARAVCHLVIGVLQALLGTTVSLALGGPGAEPAKVEAHLHLQP